MNLEKTRQSRAALRQLRTELRDLRQEQASARTGYGHWGLPWCVGGEHCEGPACAGCGMVAHYADRAAEYAEPIRNLADRLKALTPTRTRPAASVQMAMW